MLVLSRQVEEEVYINGEQIKIKVVDIRGEKVRLGIEAPAHVSVHRKEVYDAIQRERKAAEQQQGPRREYGGLEGKAQ